MKPLGYRRGIVVVSVAAAILSAHGRTGLGTWA
jgi:hypothetical protein